MTYHQAFDRVGNRLQQPQAPGKHHRAIQRACWLFYALCVGFLLFTR